MKEYAFAVITLSTSYGIWKRVTELWSRLLSILIESLPDTPVY